MEDKAYHRSIDLPTTIDHNEQPTKASRVEKWIQGHDSTSTITSMSTGSGISVLESSQNMEQQMQQK